MLHPHIQFPWNYNGGLNSNTNISVKSYYWAIYNTELLPGRVRSCFTNLLLSFLNVTWYINPNYLCSCQKKACKTLLLFALYFKRNIYLKSNFSIRKWYKFWGPDSIRTLELPLRVMDLSIGEMEFKGSGSLGNVWEKQMYVGSNDS